MLTRRDWLLSVPLLWSAVARTSGRAHVAREPVIDRRAVASRHDVRVRRVDPLAPLSVGNGEFAFTADVTGLQTFPQAYEHGTPLCTQSQWGWHTFPRFDGRGPDDLRLERYDTHGRPVGYATSRAGQEELFDWLRENPHRLHLGRIGLLLRDAEGRPVPVGALQAIDQRLTLGTAIITSTFRIDDVQVVVETGCHPSMDAVACVIRSPLVARGQVAVVLEFPYASPAITAAAWNAAALHRSSLRQTAPGRADIDRVLDETSYGVALAWDRAATLTPEGAHRFVLRADAPQSALGFVCRFTERPATDSVPSPAEVFDASRGHWERFWASGAAVDLDGSRDARAPELERRIVLSEYLTAIQCAGSRPPQETGLTCNSWYGKFHLEMHWWHAAHFALWGRTPLLERSLAWYERVLPAAQALARRQGYAGARWPKMVGPEGRDSPSPIGPLLIWQQPHVIEYAELCYRSHPDRATLDRYRSLVFETAEFMTSFAYRNPRGRYMLGPPVIPAQELHAPRTTWNPTFELAYWAHGLRTAQRWRERLGLAREARWDAVLTALAPLPTAGGVYLAHENAPDTFTHANRDHPSMLAALGVLPGDSVDRDIMRATLRRVMDTWRWDTTWGWDYPVVAMCATRLGEPALAVDALLMDTPKNRYLPNGHNWQRPNLPVYLPGNGGLLAAIALMASPARDGTAAGFPASGWTVRAEGFPAVEGRL